MLRSTFPQDHMFSKSCWFLDHIMLCLQFINEPIPTIENYLKIVAKTKTSTFVNLWNIWSLKRIFAAFASPNSDNFAIFLLFTASHPTSELSITSRLLPCDGGEHGEVQGLEQIHNQASDADELFLKPHFSWLEHLKLSRKWGNHKSTFISNILRWHLFINWHHNTHWRKKARKTT